MTEALKQKIKKIFKEQRFAVIATQDNNEPYTNLVTFLSNEDLEKIYFPTSKKTQKFKNLSRNSRISILIDNRGNKPKDIQNAMAVTAVGKTSEIYDHKINNDFLKKHPYLVDFINSKDCTMIEINIDKYIVVDNFQNVDVLNIKNENV